MLKKLHNYFLLNSLKQFQPILTSSGHRRFYSEYESCISEIKRKGLVLGVYSDRVDPYNNPGILTPTAEKYNTTKTKGKLMESLIKSGPTPGLGEAKVFFNLEEEFTAVAVIGLGYQCLGYDDYEDIDRAKEIIRIAAGVGANTLHKLHVPVINVESFVNAESAAEGALMATWRHQSYRSKSKKSVPDVLPYECDDDVIDSWRIGVIKAEAQNLARELTESPANIMTPRMFAQNAVEVLCTSGINVEVKVEAWANLLNMGAFLGVGRGSCEPPIFLELNYYGSSYEEKPIMLIGSGVTFDSGGICLHDLEHMQYMRGDKSGGSCVIATMRAIANLKLPVNVRGIIPLCENMPGCDAYKPGDVLVAGNGLEVLAETTANEGRIILGEALHYCHRYDPKLIIDVGSVSTDMTRIMGSSASGVFTVSDSLWEKIKMAGVHTGDRVWRMPLWKMFTRHVTKTQHGHVTNEGYGKGAGACKAAAFLREFVPPGSKWVHIDTRGVFWSDGKEPVYIRRGMSGRPTRTLIEFIAASTCEECQ